MDEHAPKKFIKLLGTERKEKLKTKFSNCKRQHDVPTYECSLESLLLHFHYLDCPFDFHAALSFWLCVCVCVYTYFIYRYCFAHATKIEIQSFSSILFCSLSDGLGEIQSILAAGLQFQIKISTIPKVFSNGI